MSALYFHIPFCKTRCSYCAFFSSTYRELKDKYVAALCRELHARAGNPTSKHFFTGEGFKTVYFGGGTPSQLSLSQLQEILTSAAPYISNAEEITIECNPDDITQEYAEGLVSMGFNRVSLGVQTFDNRRLKFINRRHNAEKAASAVSMLKEAGFKNISIDLMYGFPDQTLDDWQRDIDSALALNVQHISCYCLTYEEETPLYDMLQRGDIAEISDELASDMYYLLIDKLTAKGYHHYEISNFAMPGWHSRHNSAYWDGTHYMGIGAGAHSYNGNQRWWNICDVKAYIKALKEGKVKGISESEILTDVDKYNEFVMTRLRTSRGICKTDIPADFRKEFTCAAKPYINNGLLEDTPSAIRLSRKALFVSDSVISSLFI